MTFTAHHSSSSGNLFSVEENGRTLAIECGVRFPVMREALNFGVSRLDGLLLSHHHGDHSKSCKEVMRAGVDVWASAETWEVLGFNGSHRKLLTPKRQASIGPWTVMPFDLRHDVPALGFIIVSPARETLVFVCDTAYSPYTFPPAEIYALECNYSREILLKSEVAVEHKKRVMRNHMGLERVIQLLQANDLSRTREIHLLHLSDAHSDEEAFQRSVAAATGKPVYVAPK